MEGDMLLYALTVASVCFTFTRAVPTKLEFESSTKTFLPSLTPNMTLTCDTSSQNSHKLTAGSGGLVGRRDTTGSSTAAIRYLSSMVILRNGTDTVASVTKHTAAMTGVADTNMLQVTGHITGGEGSLEVTWKYPTEVQSGDYVCEAAGLSSLGQDVKLSDTLKIGVSQPSIDDLVKHISGLKLNSDKQQLDMADQKRDIVDLSQQVAALKTANSLQAQQISELKHVESGQIDCQDSSSWGQRLVNTQGAGADRYTTKTVHFRSPFSSETPVVHLSPAYIYGKDSQFSMYFYIDLVSVSRVSFIMRCRTHVDDRIDGMAVSWLGLAQ